MSLFTSARMVGPTKLPPSKCGTTISLPSSNIRAPLSTPLWTNLHIRSFACLLITGPRSASLAIPELTTRLLARFTNSSSHGSEPPTKTAVLNAMHLCPAAPNPAAIRAFSVASLSASGRMIAWFFAPILH
uniref:Pco061337 n=1 Tax=Arundo donax TaxID=35708 RepID=A0A0A9FWL9_ARUDO